jgi:type IV pilus assembly protein PilM
MDNPFKSILSGINIFGSGGDNTTAVGIDIGSSAIKIVQIRKRGGKAMLETYGAISLGPYADTDIGKVTNLPPETIVEALKEVLNASGVSTKQSALAIPSSSSLLFNINLPAQIGENMLASVVPTEARKYIPVPIDEVSLDYFLFPKKEPSFEEMQNQVRKTKEETNELVVIATQNEAIEKYRTIIKQADLVSSFFEVEMFSAVRANFDHELSPVLLVDLGASKTKVSIVELGTVHSFHTINRGGAEITESISRSLNISFSKAEEMKKEYGLYGSPIDRELVDIIKTHTDYIFSEINSVLLGYEKKYGRSITKIIFTGGGSLMKGLIEVSTNNFKIETVNGRPFSKINTPVFLEKALELIGGEFAIALGLALRKLQ